MHPTDIPFRRVPVQAYSDAGVPYTKWATVGMPYLNRYREFLRVPFFLYASKEDARAGKNFGGTGFCIGFRGKHGVVHHYAVSNWHVTCRDGFSVIRSNKWDGQTDIFDLGPENWFFVPDGPDVAVSPIKLNDRVHLQLSIGPDFLLSNETVRQIDVGPGDEVFMAGRFIDYDGGVTNLPAVRFGHVSIVNASIRQSTGYEGPCYVLDMHSRSGFSGSPVFVYRTTLTEFGAKPNPPQPPESHLMALLGIHWGQFADYWQLHDGPLASSPEASSLITDGKYVEGLSGMTCVCPTQDILDLLKHPRLVEMREYEEAQAAKRGGIAVTESAAPSTKADNPSHKEDFTRLLNAAVKSPKRDD